MTQLDFSKTALLVIDFQNDFCPPSGSLAVPNARDALPTINQLLRLPFAVKLASQDFHPARHVSFASSHPAPDNQPFVSTACITNPLNSAESTTIALWPDHCVQDTWGADLVSELDTSKLDGIITKGTDGRTEMLSAFRDVFSDPPGAQSELQRRLREQNVDTVVVVGLAADYCVKWTALHAAELGWKTFVVREGVRAVDGSDLGWQKLNKDFAAKGVHIVDTAHLLASDALPM